MILSSFNQSQDSLIWFSLELSCDWLKYEKIMWILGLLDDT